MGAIPAGAAEWGGAGRLKWFLAIAALTERLVPGLVLSILLASSELITATLPARRLGSPSYGGETEALGAHTAQGTQLVNGRDRICSQSGLDSGAVLSNHQALLLDGSRKVLGEQELSPGDRLGEGNPRVEERK